MKEKAASAGRQTNLNIGRTCSECVVEMNAVVTWLIASINACDCVLITWKMFPTSCAILGCSMLGFKTQELMMLEIDFIRSYSLLCSNYAVISLKTRMTAARSLN